MHVNRILEHGAVELNASFSLGSYVWGKVAARVQSEVRECCKALPQFKHIRSAFWS